MSYTLCSSGFVDNVMFSHNGPMARQVYFLTGDRIRIQMVQPPSECFGSDTGDSFVAVLVAGD